jgi:hypothetical protein
MLVDVVICSGRFKFLTLVVQAAWLRSCNSTPFASLKKYRFAIFPIESSIQPNRKMCLMQELV